MWDGEGVGDPVVPECAMRQQSAWEGGVRNWRGEGGSEGACFTEAGQRELPGPAKRIFPGPPPGLARGFLGEWLPLPTS